MATESSSRWNETGEDVIVDPAIMPHNPKRAGLDDGTSLTNSQRSPKRKQRNRPQVSCANCHIRKQACDKEQPCGRCLRRGVADTCQYEGKLVAGDSSPKRLDASPRPRGGKHKVEAGREPTLEKMKKHIITLERLLKTAAPNLEHAELIIEELRAGYRPDLADATTEDVETAAVALGQLAKSTAVEGSYQFHGPGSVADFLGLEGTIQPVASSTKSMTSVEMPAGYLFELPKRDIVEYLVATFYGEEVNSIIGRFTTIRQDTVEQKLRAYFQWKDARDSSLLDTSIPQPTTLSFLSYVSILLATALQFLPETGIPFMIQHGVEVEVYEQRLRIQSRSMLDESEADELPDLLRVDSLVLQALYLKNCGRPTHNYYLIGQAIRTAQAMGMHREGAKKWHLSPYEAEQRRLTWWRLFAYDRMSNFAFGRPYVINEHHCDVALPANLNLLDFKPTDMGPLKAEDPNVLTRASYDILEIEMARITGRISDRVFSARSSTYKDVWDCDAELVAWDANLPTALRSPSFETLQQRPYLARQFQLLQLQYYWLRTVLHRPYLIEKLPESGSLDPYARSRSLAVSCSQRLLSIQRDIQLSLTREQKRFFLFPFQTFEGAVNLALAIIQDPQNITKAEMLDPWINDARSTLLKMGPENVVAREAVQCIDALRRKMFSILPFSTRMGPLDGFEMPENSSTRIPYLGVLASLNHIVERPSYQKSSPGSNGTPASSLLAGTPPEWAGAGLDLKGDGQDLSAEDPASLTADALSSWPLGIAALETLNGDWQWQNLLQSMGIDSVG